jgi:hypothetical protein
MLVCRLLVSFSLLLQPQLQGLLQMFAQAVSLWRNMVSNGATLDYPTAAEMIQNSEAMSKSFLEACRRVGGVSCCHCLLLRC